MRAAASSHIAARARAATVLMRLAAGNAADENPRNCKLEYTPIATWLHQIQRLRSQSETAQPGF
jgi:hypothetical protein